ncbi:hypothetical protein GQ457_09G029360 [Hibiscus cannabinus]
MSNVEHQPTPTTHDRIHGNTSHDAAETDTTQSGLVNKSGAKSYVDSVLGNNSKPKQSTNTNYLDNVVVHDEDCIVERNGSFPIVRFSERVHDQIDQCMRNVLVLRLLGRNISFKTLLSRIQMLWKPVGEFRLIDIDNNYFLVQFASEHDYMKVLMGGPWTVYGNYLTIQPWSRKFSTSEKHPSQVLVWVRLPGLPYKYYTKALFRRIAEAIGNVVKVDYNTLEGDRGRFARLALLVDLNKPLLSCVGIDGFVQKVEYENLSQICFTCGKYGHAQELCESRSTTETDTVNGEPRRPIKENSASLGDIGTELYGPWMNAGTRRRKPRVANDSTRSVNVQAPTTGGSRFGVLETVEDDQEPMVEVVLPKRNSLPQQEKVSITTSTSEDVGPAHPIQHNPAYLASNPEKRSKIMKTKASGVIVVPMVAGQPTKVFTHKSSSSKTHAAVSIVEKGHGASARPGIRVNKQHAAVTKQTKVTLPSLGLRGNNVNTGSQVQPAIQEWVQHVSNKIVEIGNQVGSTGTKQRLLTLENVSMLVSNSDSGADDEDMTVLVEDDTEDLHGKALVQRYCRSFFREHHPRIVATFEPQISGTKADKVIAKLGFPSSFRVEAHGFSGGVWLLWDHSVQLEVTHIANQFVHGRFLEEGGSVWVHFTAVYASPHNCFRRHIWEQLMELDPGEAVPWIIRGDFNAIAHSDERRWGSSSVSGVIRLFAEFICSSGLIDLGFTGPAFMWNRGNLYQRLDRCLVNTVWSSLFPNGYVAHLDRLGSDHRPLLLKTSSNHWPISERPFRYIAAWNDHPNFPEFLNSVWQNDRDFEDNLGFFKAAAHSWNSDVFGHIGKKKKRLLARLRGIDRALNNAHSDYLVDLQHSLRDELELILEQEESFWMQKACASWVKYGDRNTKFFHTSVMTRRRRNKIMALKEDNETWISDQEDLQIHAVSFFQQLFTSSMMNPSAYEIRVWNIWLLRNSIVFENPIEDTRPLLDRCRHLCDTMSRCNAPIWGSRFGVDFGGVRFVGLSGGGCVRGHGRMLILAHIEELLRQNWLVEFRSIHRGGNIIADTLAKLVCLGDLKYTWFVEPPAAVRLLLQKEGPSRTTSNT